MRGKSILLSGLLTVSLAYAQDVPRVEPPPQATAQRPGAPVGFVTHPLMEPLQGNIKKMAEVPATAELSNLFCWTMTKDYGPSDTVKIDEPRVKLQRGDNWLREIYRSGRVGYPILDTSITHSEIPWRQAMTRRLGENVIGSDGVARNWSSYHSETFRQSVFAYIDQIIDWVKVNDPEKRIPGYFDGAEWFWPWGSYDYSPVALKAFRDWMKQHYTNIEAVNNAWGTGYADFSTVDPPRSWGTGDYTTGHATYALGGATAGMWCSPTYRVEPGQDLVASVDVETSGTLDGFSLLTLHWLDEQGKEIANAAPFSLEPEQQGKGRIEGHVQVPMPLKESPALIRRMQLRLEQHGPGKAVFRNPQVLDAISGKQPAWAAGVSTVGASQGWTCIKLGMAQDGFAMEHGQPSLSLEVKTQPLAYKHAGVAFEDWQLFCFESMAAWLDECAQHIKSRDPQRVVASYVGWVFAMMAQWDGAIQEQRFDISLANSPHIDVNGFQMCIAGDEYTQATFLVDMARKYNKPMWATDLVDFPYGLFSGLGPIYRGSMATVQHGLDGFFYYNWWGTADYSYSDHLTGQELKKLLDDDQSAIMACRDYALSTDVVVISPIMSFSLADEGGMKGDPLDAGGLYHLVLDLGLIPDVWTPYEIEKKGIQSLNAYKIAFISDCPVLTPQANAALRKFVERGGILLGTGQPPTRDFAGNALADPLPIKPRGDKGVEATLGQGRIVWNAAKLGKQYWGKVRRVAVYGNTPGIAVEVPDAKRTPQLRRQMREMVKQQVTAAGYKPEVELDLRTGQVHLSCYQKPNGERLLFLVHKGEGRIYNTPLKVNLKGLSAEAKVQTDFDKELTATLDAEGNLLVPAFTHCCLVRLSPKP